MELKDILTISGHPDLYKLVAQARNGIIVESLVNKKRMQAFASMRISNLQDIIIYTEDSEISFEDLLSIMFEKAEGKVTIDHKSKSEELKAYFTEILPDYNKQKVHISDMKKIVKWYNIIIQEELFDFSKKEEETEEKDETQNEEKDEVQEIEKTEEKVENDENKEEIKETKSED